MPLELSPDNLGTVSQSALETQHKNLEAIATNTGLTRIGAQLSNAWETIKLLYNKNITFDQAQFFWSNKQIVEFLKKEVSTLITINKVSENIHIIADKTKLDDIANIISKTFVKCISMKGEFTALSKDKSELDNLITKLGSQLFSLRKLKDHSGEHSKRVQILASSALPSPRGSPDSLVSPKESETSGRGRGTVVAETATTQKKETPATVTSEIDEQENQNSKYKRENPKNSSLLTRSVKTTKETTFPWTKLAPGLLTAGLFMTAIGAATWVNRGLFGRAVPFADPLNRTSVSQAPRPDFVGPPWIPPTPSNTTSVEPPVTQPYTQPYGALRNFGSPTTYPPHSDQGPIPDVVGRPLSRPVEPSVSQSYDQPNQGPNTDFGGPVQTPSNQTSNTSPFPASTTSVEPLVTQPYQGPNTNFVGPVQTPSNQTSNTSPSPASTTSVEPLVTQPYQGSNTGFGGPIRTLSNQTNQTSKTTLGEEEVPNDSSSPLTLQTPYSNIGTSAHKDNPAQSQSQDSTRSSIPIYQWLAGIASGIALAIFNQLITRRASPEHRDDAANLPPPPVNRSNLIQVLENISDSDAPSHNLTTLGRWAYQQGYVDIALEFYIEASNPKRDGFDDPLINKCVLDLTDEITNEKNLLGPFALENYFKKNNQLTEASSVINKALKIVEEGNQAPENILALGELFLKKVPPNLKKAMKCFNKAIEAYIQVKDSKKLFEIGNKLLAIQPITTETFQTANFCFNNIKNNEELEKAATENNAFISLTSKNMADQILLQQPITIVEAREAGEWYTLAANPEGLTKVANHFANLAKNEPKYGQEALIYYENAARKGDPKAITVFDGGIVRRFLKSSDPETLYLAGLYTMHGVVGTKAQPDEQLGIQRILKAANLGSENAQDLIRSIELGEGSAQQQLILGNLYLTADPQKAYELFAQIVKQIKPEEAFNNGAFIELEKAYDQGKIQSPTIKNFVVATRAAIGQKKEIIEAAEGESFKTAELVFDAFSYRSRQELIEALEIYKKSNNVTPSELMELGSEADREGYNDIAFECYVEASMPRADESAGIIRERAAASESVRQIVKKIYADEDMSGRFAIEKYSTRTGELETAKNIRLQTLEIAKKGNQKPKDIAALGDLFYSEGIKVDQTPENRRVNLNGAIACSIITKNSARLVMIGSIYLHDESSTLDHLMQAHKCFQLALEAGPSKQERSIIDVGLNEIQTTSASLAAKISLTQIDVTHETAEKAAKLYFLANDSNGLYQAARCFDDALSQKSPKDNANKTKLQALQYYEASARLGNDRAIASFNGGLVNRYKKATDHETQYEIGLLLLRGIDNVLEIDMEAGIDFLGKVATKAFPYLAKKARDSLVKLAHGTPTQKQALERCRLRNSQITYQLYYSLLQEGNSQAMKEQARRELVKAFEEDNIQSPEILETIGDEFAARSDARELTNTRDQALKAYKKASELDPENEQLKEKYTELDDLFEV